MIVRRWPDFNFAANPSSLTFSRLFTSLAQPNSILKVVSAEIDLIFRVQDLAYTELLRSYADW